MGYFRGSFWWIGVLALAGCVPREALLTLLLRGEILRQIFDFSGIVGLVSVRNHRSDIPSSSFLKCFSLRLKWIYSTWFP